VTFPTRVRSSMQRPNLPAGKGQRRHAAAERDLALEPGVAARDGTRNQCDHSGGHVGGARNTKSARS
jgi:hypothetical protein